MLFPSSDGSYYSVDAGCRMSTVPPKLHPRLNLNIRPNSLTTRVLFDGKKAVAVEVESGGETFRLRRISRMTVRSDTSLPPVAVVIILLPSYGGCFHYHHRFAGSLNQGWLLLRRRPAASGFLRKVEHPTPLPYPSGVGLSWRAMGVVPRFPYPF